MKKMILSTGFALLLVAAMPAPSWAQNQVDAKLAKAMEILQLTGARTTMLGMANSLLPKAMQAQRSAHPEIPAAFWDEFAAAFQDVLMEKSAGLLQDIAQIYAAEFSEDEMDAIIGFYHTDVGQKTIHDLPVLMQQSIQIAQRWALEVGTEAGKRAADKMRKKTQGQ